MQDPGGIAALLAFIQPSCPATISFNLMKSWQGVVRAVFDLLRARSGGFGRKEGFDVGDGVGDAVGREGLKKDLAVALAGDAGIEEDEDAAIFKGADKAAEALLESENGFGNLVVEEGAAAGFFDGAHAGLNDGVGGNGEGEAVDDDATKRFALDVDALPKT